MSDSHADRPLANSCARAVVKTVLGGFGELEREHLVYTGTPFAPWDYHLHAGYTKHSRPKTRERARLRH